MTPKTSLSLLDAVHGSRSNLLVAVVALGVGVAAGYLIGGASSATSDTRGRDPLAAPDARGTSASPEVPSAKSRPPAAPLDAPPVEEDRVTPPGAGIDERAPAAAGARASEDCEALRREVATLRTMAFAERAAREDTEGRPIPFPPGVDPKYRAPALIANFSEAARTVGSAAEIEDVDCTELPCLMYGSVRAGEAGAEATREELIALMRKMEADYLGAGKWFSASAFEPGAGETGQTYLRFTLSFYPNPAQGSPEQEALNKRMRFRRDQYNASAPGAPE